jgi:ankyrin repeat protein
LQAAEENNQKRLEQAVASGADIDASRVTRGNTALHFAVYKDNIQMAKRLVLSGANINCQDRYGNTPLHIASGQGQRAMLKFLLCHGADCSIKNARGQTAMHVAFHQNILRIFIRAAEPSAKKISCTLL